MNKLKGGLLAVLAVLGTAVSLSLSSQGVAHAQAVTLDPTQQGNINAAVGSIPTTAISEVFAIFPVVMPYILLVVTIGIAFFIMKMLMNKGHGH